MWSLTLGFLLKHLDKIIYGLIAVAIVLAIGAIGYGVRDTSAKRDIAVLEKNYADERTKAAQAAAEAERAARAREHKLAALLAELQGRYADEVAVRDRRIADLDRTGRGLQQRLAALTKPGSTAGSTDPACKHLQVRLEAIGSLLAERDGMARSYAEDLERLGSEFRICRGYAESIAR